MAHTDEKIIELSKTKLVLLLTGSVLFVALGVWLFSLDDAFIQSQRRYNNPTVIHALGVAAIVFFGLCAVFAVKKLFDRNPGLVLNEAGVTDNASGVAAGFIPWSEMVGTAVFEIQRQKMLVVLVVNPEKYFERGGLLKRWLNKGNYKMCGSPVVISANALKINFSELNDLFERYINKYGKL